jgi:hypothetical protein
MAVVVAFTHPVTWAEEPQSQPAAQTQPAPQTQPAEKKAPEPDHIRVQHILIGFQGSARPTSSERPADEAKKLASEILERAKKGEDFGELVRQYTDDRPPGIYAMANNGIQERPGEFPRARMVPAFGDVGFPLKVGEIGMSVYDAKKSPYGYHIIKRLE